MPRAVTLVATRVGTWLDLKARIASRSDLDAIGCYASRDESGSLE